MEIFNRLPRSDTFSLRNEHDIYRKYLVPGLRESKDYSGTGIEKTYNMSMSDRDMPLCEEAVPALLVVDVGNGSKLSIMRKSVTHDTDMCPECDTACVVDSGETFCPECGVVLTEPSEEFVRTPETAGRYVND